MHRFATQGSDSTVDGRPDMTVLEAADAMERAHRSQLFIRNRDQFLGVLTEADIVRKVLAEGRRPDLVRVSEIMSAGWQRTDGSLLLEDEKPTETADSTFTLTAFAQGKCEECDNLDVDLIEVDGALMCPDCADAQRGRDA